MSLLVLIEAQPALAGLAAALAPPATGAARGPGGPALMGIAPPLGTACEEAPPLAGWLDAWMALGL